MLQLINHRLGGSESIATVGDVRVDVFDWALFLLGATLVIAGCAEAYSNH